MSSANFSPYWPHDKWLTEIELKGVQEKLQHEINNGTSMAQNAQRLEGELRWATSKAEELEGALAGSRSEREKLSTSLKATEAGLFLRFPLDHVPFVSLGADPPPLVRQRLGDRLNDSLNAATDLENRLGVSQRELNEARGQAFQHQQTISLLVSEKNALAASADRLAELEPRRCVHPAGEQMSHYPFFSTRCGGTGEKVAR